MKTTKLIFTFVLVLLFAPSVFAQEEVNQLFLASKLTVKPEKIDEYKELQKIWVSACKEHHYPFAFSVWESSLPNFYIFHPVKDYNFIEDSRSERGKMMPNMEPDYMKRLLGTVKSWDEFYLRADDDISYKPENRADGLVYAEWWISYNKPGTGMKYRNAYKRAVEMQKKANYEYHISRYQADIGMISPAIISVHWGKNPADLYTHKEKAWDNLGEEVHEMFNELSSTTIKIKKIPFWYQKDLSYSPE